MWIKEIKRKKIILKGFLKLRYESNQTKKKMYKHENEKKAIKEIENVKTFFLIYIKKYLKEKYYVKVIIK